MRKEKTLELGTMSMRIHEPTIEGIRNVLSRDDLTFDPVGFLNGKSQIPADLIALFIDHAPDTIKQLTLSEFKEVLDTIRELLSPFLDILEMLGAVNGYLRGMQEEASSAAFAS